MLSVLTRSVTLLAALERAAADDQRHMQAAVVAGALVVIVAVQVGVAVAGLESESHGRKRRG